MARGEVDAMGEGGIIEKFLGVEGEEVENDRAAPAADPIAAAVAIDAARFDPRLAREAADYLAEQRRLVSIQTEHLHEQREVQLSHLKLRRTGERLRVGLQLFLVTVGTVIGLGVVVALNDAFTSDSVVVNAFKAPAALASRGLTGDVVAASVLDGLERIQESTRGPRQGLRTRNAWSSDIKIEVPETGISIGELDRILHERFGHDVHIDGDLVQTATGLALTVRGDGVPARTFAGTSDQLSSLVTAASEYIYGSSQPWLFSIYLASNNRSADALHFLPDAFRRATTDEQRAELANVWGAALIDLDQSEPAVVKLRLAM